MMHTLKEYFLALAVLLASFSPALIAQPRPAGLPTDRNVIAFSERAERAIRSRLQKYAPLVEAYFQQTQTSKSGRWVPLKDYYALGRFTWVDKPGIENLIPHGDKSIDERLVLD